jgi:DNA replication protein DnaC
MNQISVDLKNLRLSGMAACWQSLVETRKTDELTLSDGLRLLLQYEKDHRRANRNGRLIKEAHFRYKTSLEELVFDAGRGMEKTKVLQLATCEYIRQGVPVFITGAAGTGKSWLATALGYQACLCGYKVAYFNVQKLFGQVALARIEGNLPRFLDRMAHTDLLIIDDFGIKILDAVQLLDLMELIEDRHARHSTIIVSQLPVSAWYDVMNVNTTAADAILDRVVHTALRFELKGDSLRKNG